MARTLADASELRGLFGVDFLRDGDTVLLVELNPRYPASVEILERASGISMMSLYRDLIPDPPSVTAKAIPVQSVLDCPSSDHGRRIVDLPISQTFAKVVVYACERFRFPDVSETSEGACLDQSLELADVPVSGTFIEKGWPICTIICRGSSISHTMDNARRQVERLRDWLRNSDRDQGVLDRSDNPR
jgi:predicted ATP-grasp superfamily ATP-dependent carboligase